MSRLAAAAFEAQVVAYATATAREWAAPPPAASPPPTTPPRMGLAEDSPQLDVDTDACGGDGGAEQRVEECRELRDLDRLRVGDK